MKKLVWKIISKNGYKKKISSINFFCKLLNNILDFRYKKLNLPWFKYLLWIFLFLIFYILVENVLSISERKIDNEYIIAISENNKNMIVSYIHFIVLK